MVCKYWHWHCQCSNVWSKWGINETQKWVCFLRTLGQRWHCNRTDMGEWGEIKVADLFGQTNCRIPMGNNDWRDQKGSGCGDGTFADAFAFTIFLFCFFIIKEKAILCVTSRNSSPQNENPVIIYSHVPASKFGYIFPTVWNTKELFSIQWQFLLTMYGQ